MSTCETCGHPTDEHGGMNFVCPSGPSHTPGPWDWSAEGARIVAPHEALGSVVIAKIAFVAPESVANAHLIKAAPDLYAALKAVISVADRKTVEFDLAHAAIAKANGIHVSTEPTDGFPFIVTCRCGAKTGFAEPTVWRFECRDCGRLNEGDPSIPAPTSHMEPK